jgi:hypothetical protein
VWCVVCAGNINNPHNKKGKIKRSSSTTVSIFHPDILLSDAVLLFEKEKIYIKKKRQTNPSLA